MISLQSVPVKVLKFESEEDFHHVQPPELQLKRSSRTRKIPAGFKHYVIEDVQEQSIMEESTKSLNDDTKDK